MPTKIEKSAVKLCRGNFMTIIARCVTVKVRLYLANAKTNFYVRTWPQERGVLLHVVMA